MQKKNLLISTNIFGDKSNSLKVTETVTVFPYFAYFKPERCGNASRTK